MGPSTALSSGAAPKRARQGGSIITGVLPAAIDLFAGAGGATQGLRQAGFTVVAAVENDRDAAASFGRNHRDVVLAEQDIRTIDPYALRRFLGLAPRELALLKACPPCQGFSSLARGGVDESRNDLVLTTYAFVQEFLPAAVLLENVPGLRHDHRLGTLLGWLDDLGYRHAEYRVDAAHLGVPQRRRRLIVLATRDDIADPPVDLMSSVPPTFKQAPVTAGEALTMLARERKRRKRRDPMDRARTSRPAVASRIAAIPVGGSRFDLPAEHQLPCHKALVAEDRPRRVATSSYGRIKSDEVAPTMTTRCTTPACGAFIHPTLHRGITLREAAIFQTFPVGYHFEGGHDSIERQIGNAVPVRMAKVLGLVVLGLLASSNVLAATTNSTVSVARYLRA